jgi:alpha-glucoside transport system substrate-binding protein
MMQRKRGLFALLLALAMVVAACSGDTDTSDTTTAADDAATTAAPDDTTETTVAPDDSTDDTAPSGDGGSVTVFGPESSDAEAGAIIEVLTAFGEENGIDVTYQGARDAEEQVNVQVAGGNPPDIFVFPQPGKLADFARAGNVLPLPDDVAATVSTNWSDAWTVFGNVDGTQYGVPVKADLKSLVWYQPQVFEEKGYAVPETFDDLVTLSNDMIAAGDTPWCVGIESGPATGWAFTDWVEDMMLRQAGVDAYDRWVTNELPFNSPEVKTAWETVLNLWNTEGAVFASGGTIAATPFGENALPLLNGDCLMHRQASFFSSFFTADDIAASAGGPVNVFYFPSVTGDRPVLGAGTLLGAFRDAPEVWAVMSYMSSPDYAMARQTAQAALNGGTAGETLSGFLSAANGQDMSVYNELEQSMLDILATAEVVRFDASDLMPADVGAGTFWSEATAVVNGEKSVDEALEAIDASWP